MHYACHQLVACNIHREVVSTYLQTTEHFNSMQVKIVHNLLQYGTYISTYGELMLLLFPPRHSTLLPIDIGRRRKGVQPQQQ